jgi:hypothetical protein
MYNKNNLSYNDDELFYGDWHGTMVPSGTIKFDFFEPLITIVYGFF